MGLMKKIFGNYSEKEVKRVMPIVNQINALEPEMEKLSEEKASVAINNIEQIREQVKVLEANYNRLSYIMFLLNQPNKEKKKSKYFKQEKKKLNKIPINERKEAVINEKTKVRETLKSYS